MSSLFGAENEVDPLATIRSPTDSPKCPNPSGCQIFGRFQHDCGESPAEKPRVETVWRTRVDSNHRHSLFGQKSRVSQETRASPSNSAQRENQNGRFRHCFAPYSIRLRLGICVQITAVVNAGIRHLAECQGTTLEHVSAAARRNTSCSSST